MTLADRVVMNKGVIQQVGTPTEICDAPANTFVGFIGSPAMNLINGTLGWRLRSSECPHRGASGQSLRASDARLPR